VNGTAETLPFADETFDFVVSRVSLPYTDLQRSLLEINRVLADGGTVWFTLHSFQHVASGLLRSLRALRVKDVILRLYVILNGVVLHVRGWQFPLVIPFGSRRYESFQTIGGMTAAMGRSGFENVWVRKSGTHLVCTARKKPASS
jgi:SAM-dependent methyltransferase